MRACVRAREQGEDINNLKISLTELYFTFGAVVANWAFTRVCSLFT